MPGLRVNELVAKLEKGHRKTNEILSTLTTGQWQQVVYAEPYPWTVRDLLAHFVSAEELLLRLAQAVAAGDPGAPEGYDYDAINAQEQKRLAGRSVQDLLADLDIERRATIEWVGTLEEETLDRVGRHPALGEIPLEMMIAGIYGHQLFHMRDLQKLF
jgi:hypothetical protein